MPTTDVIGAYMLSLSGDGSLLQETGLLTSAGVAAIGFGDIAQLEYRHSAAISVSGVNAPLPGVGVQIKLPIPEYNAVPAFGIAFRLFLDFVRKKQNHREEPVAEPEAVDARKSAEETVAEMEGLRIAEGVLQSLELDRRAVFLLHEIDEVPIPEVAETLGIPPNTAYSRLRLARRDGTGVIVIDARTGAVAHRRLGLLSAPRPSS